MTAPHYEFFTGSGMHSYALLFSVRPEFNVPAVSEEDEKRGRNNSRVEIQDTPRTLHGFI